MGVSVVRRYVLSACVAVAMLAGCGGTPIGAPGSMPQSSAIASHADRSFLSKHRTTSCPCLYVTNVNHNRVTVYASGATGNAKPIQNIHGSKTGLNHPHDVAVDGSGNIYVVNAFPASVTVYAPGATGNVKPTETIRGRNTKLNLPTGIDIDSVNGDIYVSNINGGPSRNGSITIYAPGSRGDASPIGVIQGLNTLLEHPNCLVLDAGGNIGVTNVRMYYPGRVTFYSAGSTGNVAPARVIEGTATKIGWPTQIALDSRLNTYVANHNDVSLTVYAPGANGNVAPTQDIKGGRTRLISPFGIAADSDGNIYAASGIASVSRVTVYAAGANGNARPMEIIQGSRTGLDFPQGIAIH
jgi:hypothetical protein